MKRVLSTALLGSLLLVLSACSGVITVDVGLPEGVTITNANYSSNYQANVEGSTQDVICDDRTTELSYSFRFSGNLNGWQSYLRGVTTGNITGRESFTLDSRFVDYNSSTNTVTVRYEIPARSAPLAINPQAIVIQPKVEGYTQLFLEFNGATGAYDLLSDDIPVLASCN